MTAKIKLNAASGGGSFSLQAPSSSSNARVMTLPDTADGTILTTTNPKAGNIIQVVSVTKTDTFSTTSSSFTDVTGLSVAITPTSTSSKIFITINVMAATDNSTQGYFEIFRTSDNTSVCIGADGGGSRQRASFGPTYFNDTNDLKECGMSFLDSPNTTSAFNYKVRCKNQGSGNVYVGRSNSDGDAAHTGRYPCTITVMEVAA